MKIFINPGHDSKRKNGEPVDAGAVNTSYKVCEADICINIGNRVAEYLKMDGHDVEIQQDDNLVNVVDYANENNYDFFISIHCNAYNERVQGTEVWYYKGSNKGRELARCIQKTITSRCGTVDRGVKETADLYVCRKTHMPAVLVETAFIDNNKDFVVLYEHPELFAMAIVEGVNKWLSNEE